MSGIRDHKRPYRRAPAIPATQADATSPNNVPAGTSSKATSPVHQPSITTSRPPHLRLPSRRTQPPNTHQPPTTPQTAQPAHPAPEHPPAAHHTPDRPAGATTHRPPSRPLNPLGVPAGAASHRPRHQQGCDISQASAVSPTRHQPTARGPQTLQQMPAGPTRASRLRHSRDPPADPARSPPFTQRTAPPRRSGRCGQPRRP
jgi:hypothetical protein